MKRIVVAMAAIILATVQTTNDAFVASTPQEAEVKPLIDDLVTANHILYHEKIFDGLGHISVRHPLRPTHFLMSRAKAPGLVTADDILEFDADAVPVDNANHWPIYSERYIHSEIYKQRKDVNSVVHSHAPPVIPFSVRCH